MVYPSLIKSVLTSGFGILWKLFFSKLKIHNLAPQMTTKLGLEGVVVSGTFGDS